MDSKTLIEKLEGAESWSRQVVLLLGHHKVMSIVAGAGKWPEQDGDETFNKYDNLVQLILVNAKNSTNAELTCCTYAILFGRSCYKSENKLLLKDWID